MGVNSYDDIFGQKAKQRPNLFQKFMNYGVGAAKVIGSVGEGLTGNPMGFIDAAQHFGDMVRIRWMDNYKKVVLYYNIAFRTEIWIIPENRFRKCKKLFRQCLPHY